MLLSKLLNEFSNTQDYVIKNEKKFDYLGLTASNGEGELCVFLDDVKYIKDLKENVTMIITNNIIANLLENRSISGICIVEHPREFFFRIHNLLADKREKCRPVRLKLPNTPVRAKVLY